VIRPYPEGWFRVLGSGDLPPGSVRTVRVFGRELVVYRTALGRALAAEPWCPHAGAHLGHGGCVEGEALKCPFHGLRYGVDGRCVPKPKENARDRSSLSLWPTEIWQGQVMLFYSADRRNPDWPLPRLEQGNWLEPRWLTLRLQGHVQDVAENGVDLGHFSTVHRYSNLRDPELAVEGFKLHSRFGFDRQNPLWARLGAVSAVFDTDIWGLGCSITDLRVSPLHFRLSLLATQIDERDFDFTIGISVERPRRFTRLFEAAAPALVKYMQRTIVGDVLQDRDIWAHRRWLERPALTAADAPVVAFRRYAARFYVNR
jgi:phenylpropionate dioxygenase-like ring-hydroxylating dioxygenase large terminal subunit